MQQNMLYLVVVAVTLLLLVRLVGQTSIHEAGSSRVESN